RERAQRAVVAGGHLMLRLAGLVPGHATAAEARALGHLPMGHVAAGLGSERLAAAEQVAARPRVELTIVAAGELRLRVAGLTVRYAGRGVANALRRLQ